MSGQSNSRSRSGCRTENSNHFRNLIQSAQENVNNTPYQLKEETLNPKQLINQT